MARFDFECQVCLEDKTEPRSQVRIINDDVVCKQCVIDGLVPLFAAAVQSELNYPPSWGNVRLDIKDYRHLLPETVREAWDERVIEYETPITKRVYCSHVGFATPVLGEKRRLSVCGQFLGSSEDADDFCCPKCRSQSKDHHIYCRCRGSGKQSEKQAKMDEATRGLDWQKCPDPTCAAVIERSSGCNHVVCAHCKMNLCSICGDSPICSSGHWDLGNPCPRYGQPGDDNAQYDEDHASDSDEEDEIEIDDHYEARVWPETWLGMPLIVPDSEMSLALQIYHDANIVQKFDYVFRGEILDSFGNVNDAPVALRPFESLVSRLRIITAAICMQIDGDTPSPLTAPNIAEIMEGFQDFRASSRAGFFQAGRYAHKLALTMPVTINPEGSYRVMLNSTATGLLIDAFERYLTIHVRQFISEFMETQFCKTQPWKLWINVEDIFAYKKRRMQDADPNVSLSQI